eukprot:TRINITY_DN9145_c0_g1_i1.p1 TRINITY_DN9145_c0_g1~~TRINITY_DN9145_c0_g1_i1.p1  ORF type:complete len:151 (-),score=31.71 TRINITY_DN9145_c0_g1_i1:154-606(-)
MTANAAQYSWTQTLAEATLCVPIPSGLRARDVECKIAQKKLYLKVRGNTSPIIDGELYRKVKPDDSFWQIEEGNTSILIELQKVNKMEWWKCIVVGDPEMQTQKIEHENSMLSDLDNETRGIVEKMMIEQQNTAQLACTNEHPNKNDSET